MLSEGAYAGLAYTLKNREDHPHNFVFSSGGVSSRPPFA